MFQNGTHARTWIIALAGAWSDIRPAFKQSEFRLLLIIGCIVLPLLVVIDISSGLLKHYGYLSSEWTALLRISEQHSVAEFVGFLALQMAAMFCFGIAWKFLASLHFTLTAVLEFLLLDDMYGLHEKAGENIGALLISGQPVAVASNLGELVYGLSACLVIGLLFWSFFRHSSAYLRSLFALLLAPFVVLGACAVGLDFIHGLVPREAKFLNGFVALAEDGGELCAMYLLMLMAAAQWIALAAPGRVEAGS